MTTAISPAAMYVLYGCLAAGFTGIVSALLFGIKR